MGYTHYWEQSTKGFSPKEWEKIVDTAREIINLSALMGIKLAGGLGEGEPEASEEKIWLNGESACGHTNADLGITWPANDALGICEIGGNNATSGEWFAGALLAARCCDGDCSHETFLLLKKPILRKGQTEPFASCKTAFKPYDIAVTAILAAAKMIAPDKIRLSSDGEVKDWAEGTAIARYFLKDVRRIPILEEEENEHETT